MAKRIFPSREIQDAYLILLYQDDIPGLRKALLEEGRVYVEHIAEALELNIETNDDLLHLNVTANEIASQYHEAIKDTKYDAVEFCEKRIRELVKNEESFIKTARFFTACIRLVSKTASIARRHYPKGVPL